MPQEDLTGKKPNKVQLGKTKFYRTIIYEIILTFLIYVAFLFY